jgi:arsenical pump membrane protein
LSGLGLVVLSYPVVSALGAPVWAVATAGAVLLVTIAAFAREAPAKIVREEVHWDTLVFLGAVLVLSIGLRNVGITERLAHLYEGASPMRVGLISALGSAVLNNHPMANLNMFALSADGGTSHTNVLAALIGGDLGPRFFPMGSLAGLMWIETLRRAGIEMSARRFVLIGAMTIPALIAGLWLL